jgi:protein arginine N-methyltransferase 1
MSTTTEPPAAENATNGSTSPNENNKRPHLPFDPPLSNIMKQKTSETTTSKSTTAEATTDTIAKPGDDRTSKDYYFDSYAHHAIHEEMLKDEVRTCTYRSAILDNPHLFENKIVLDVGCGTGILSMFAVQAGAKHVYAVDCSSIIQQAQLIIDTNGFSDSITLIQGKIEEIELPVDKVDIIVSEWMGYFLLYESMLDTVLFARDKWLTKTNGIIFPDKATMYIAAIEDAAVKRDRLDFWDNVYGFDMKAIKEIALKEPVVDVVDSKAIVTNSVPILDLDILTCTKEDAAFCTDFVLTAHRNDFINGLCAYFECAFTQVHKPIGFSTSPSCRYTHWKQTICYFDDPIIICKGEQIRGKIKCEPNSKNRRDLDIRLSIDFQGERCQTKKDLDYRLR